MAQDDICKVISSESQPSGIRFSHFVYEASYWRLHQPFVHQRYYAHLAFKGSAVLAVGERTYPIAPGTVFFTFPGQLYTLSGDRGFTYMYITFEGAEAAPLLEQFHISEGAPVYPRMNHLLEFWMDSLRRVSDYNAAVLTESVLLHTLSYINAPEELQDKDTDRFDQILHYIHNNCKDPELSVAKVADVFFYSKKYLSALFVRRTGVRFSEYLNDLRIRQAERLLRQHLPVAEISAQCGFHNPHYFSKVFKAVKGCSPLEYRKRHTAPKAE